MPKPADVRVRIDVRKNPLKTLTTDTRTPRTLRARVRVCVETTLPPSVTSTYKTNPTPPCFDVRLSNANTGAGLNPDINPDMGPNRCPFVGLARICARTSIVSGAPHA